MLVREGTAAAPNTDDPRFQTLNGTQIYTDTATTDTVNVNGHRGGLTAAEAALFRSGRT